MDALIALDHDPVEDGVWIANEGIDGVLPLQRARPPHDVIRIIDIAAFGVTSFGNTNGVAVAGDLILATDYNGDQILADDLIYGIDRDSGVLVEVWHVDGALNPNPSSSIDSMPSRNVCVVSQSPETRRR